MANDPTSSPMTGIASTKRRLRRIADEASRAVGTSWRHEVAASFECDIDEVGLGPVSRDPYSSRIKQSNFRVVLRDLQDVDKRIIGIRFPHWAVGWVQEIAVPLDSDAAIARIHHWVDRLTTSPIADETDLAALEAAYRYNPAVDPAPESVRAQSDIDGLRDRLDRAGQNDIPHAREIGL